MYDIMKDYDTPCDGEGPFYTEFLFKLQEEDSEAGLSRCDWDETKYPNLVKHKATLIGRFNEEYAFREIGQETPLRWQLFVNARFNEVAEKYDHAYKVLSSDRLDELGTGYKVTDALTRKMTSKMDSTDKFEGNGKFKDTPISGTVNNPTTEQIDDNLTTYGSTGSDTQDDSRTTTKEQHDDVIMKELNWLADQYKVLNNDFIKEFDNMFIQIFMAAI